MAEINNINNRVRTIAYYLPQYHTISENDEAWGSGFTDWVNTKKATPLFEGHYQPKIPLNNNYYDLADVNVMISQASLAKEYGLFGFCYYHYWFKNGKKLLEKPLEQMLSEPNVDIPFCLSWANENWSKMWDGGNQEIIVEQDYGDVADWKMHLEYLIPFFKDPRYITLDGNPVFLIYKPDLIPNVQRMLKYWRKHAKDYGFNDFCFMIQSPGLFYSPRYHLGEFSYQIKFPPFFSIIHDEKNMKFLKKQQLIYSVLRCIKVDKGIDKIWHIIKNKKLKENIKEGVTYLNYDKTWRTMVDFENTPEMIEGAFVDWDNTARKLNGYVHIGGTPEKFQNYLEEIIEKFSRTKQVPVIFINAWNEWAEGAYLEPDQLNGYKYLEALKSALERENE